MKKILNYFDKLEDKIRSTLSTWPVIYAIIGGIGIVLFWRGIWGLSEDIGLTNLGATLISFIILLFTGLFVSYFIGDQTIISGLRGEKKLIDKTKEEILASEDMMSKISRKLENLSGEIEEIKEMLGKSR